MWLIWLCSSASGQAVPDRFPDPNVLLGVSVGHPAIASVRVEAWLADQFSVELGFGVPRFDFERLAGDLTLRARPDAFCVGCGEQNLVLFGLGVAAVGEAPSDFETWALAIGPDVVATGVHWFTPELAGQVSLRGGFGPELVGPEVGVEAVDWWTFASLGLSF